MELNKSAQVTITEWFDDDRGWICDIEIIRQGVLSSFYGGITSASFMRISRLFDQMNLVRDEPYSQVYTLNPEQVEDAP